MPALIQNRSHGGNFFEMQVQGAFTASPGQFYMLRKEDSFMVLSRPLGVMALEQDRMSFLYKVVGEGTRLFSTLSAGASITLHGPYGNGFPIERYRDKKVALVGGGTGIAPLLFALQALPKARAFFGFRSSQMDAGSFAQLAQQLGVKERCEYCPDCDMTEFLKLAEFDAVFTCGPEAMMRKVCALHPRVYVSLERHMGCGSGACLSCTCALQGHTKKARVCKEGPVFTGQEVIWQDQGEEAVRR